MRISDWSSDVCSSDLAPPREPAVHHPDRTRPVERFALVFPERAASLFRPELPGLLLAQAAARTPAVRAGNDRRHRRRRGEFGNAPGPHRDFVDRARVQPRWHHTPVLTSDTPPRPPPPHSICPRILQHPPPAHPP